MGIEDAKPQRAEDYPAEQALLCERTLITLLRGCGPWKRGMYLAGGLVPRYLPRDPEAEEEHAGTQDIDLVLDLDELADTDAYRSLERNLKQLGFARSANPQGQARHFSWVREAAPGQRVVVDFLCKAPGAPSGRAVPVEKRLSALQIPGAHLVVEDHLEIQVQADLLEERGAATETIRVANLTPFLILKALAYDDRMERKDAYDLVWCLIQAPGGPRAAGREFARRRADHPDEILFGRALEILASRFASAPDLPGQRKDGPVSYAQFLAMTRGADPLELLQEAVSAVELFLEEARRP